MRKEGNKIERVKNHDTDTNSKGSVVLMQLRFGRSRMTP